MRCKTRPFWQEVLLATGTRFADSLSLMGLTGGIALGWLAVDFLCSWQERRWRAEWHERWTKDLGIMTGAGALAESLKKDKKR